MGITGIPFPIGKPLRLYPRMGANAGAFQSIRLSRWRAAAVSLREIVLPRVSRESFSVVCPMRMSHSAELIGPRRGKRASGLVRPLLADRADDTALGPRIVRRQLVFVREYFVVPRHLG